MEGWEGLEGLEGWEGWDSKKPVGRHKYSDGGVSPSENSRCKQREVLNYNFHLLSIFPHPAIIFNIQPQFLLVSKPKNCELKQKQNSYVWIPAFLRYPVDEIPISFPYRDMGMIWESYRSVIEIILGFLCEWYLFRVFCFVSQFFRFNKQLQICCKWEKNVGCGNIEGRWKLCEFLF